MKNLPMVAALAATTLACVPERAGLQTTQSLARERAGRALPDATKARADARTTELLAAPLTEAAAIELALLHNPELRARYAALGIARADLLAASRPRNPELEGSVLMANGQHSEIELAASLDVTSVLTLGLRRTAARSVLEAESVAAAESVLAAILTVRVAFADVQAAQQTLELARTSLAAAEAAAELAERLRAAGNITELALATEQTFREEARLVVADAALDVERARTALSGAMGVWGERARWVIDSRLGAPGDAPAAERVETDAVAASLALRQLRLRVRGAERAAAAATVAGIAPDLRVGVAASRDADIWRVGPEVGVELPVFDRGGADHDRMSATARVLRHRIELEAIAVRNAARLARARVDVAAARVQHFEEQLLPLAARVVEHTQRQYNAMTIGAFALLDARRSQVQTGRRYVRALRDYWAARAMLDALLAGHRPMAMPANADTMTAPSMKRHGDH